jgi:hypothetical protein
MEHRRQHRAKQLVRRAKERAKQKGIAFDLDGYLTEIQCRIDNGLCEVTGLPLNLEGGRTWDSPSLDRIEPKGPYLYSNVRIVCHAINMAMADWGAQKVVQMALAILAIRKQKSNELSRRLRDNLARQLSGRGSTLFDLTWKERATPSGHVLYQLVASQRRISDSDCGSWQTPKVATGKYQYTNGDKTKPFLNLEGQVKLASWPTPQERDFRSGGADRVDNPDRSNNLNDYVLLSGPISSGSPAQTESKGQLNPEFSLWLMGYPPEWLNCAPPVMRSSRKSRQSSSRPQ